MNKMRISFPNLKGCMATKRVGKYKTCYKSDSVRRKLNCKMSFHFIIHLGKHTMHVIQYNKNIAHTEYIKVQLHKTTIDTQAPLKHSLGKKSSRRSLFQLGPIKWQQTKPLTNIHQRQITLRKKIAKQKKNKTNKQQQKQNNNNNIKNWFWKILLAEKQTNKQYQMHWINGYVMKGIFGTLNFRLGSLYHLGWSTLYNFRQNG